MLAHLHETKHKLAFELHSGTILCAECDEFVLDSKFNRVLEEETRRAEGTKKRRKDEDKLGWSFSATTLYCRLALSDTHLDSQRMHFRCNRNFCKLAKPQRACATWVQLAT